MNEIKHYYLHVDLDAFFASVEQLDNPQYRGKPVIVGGKPGEKRSVVSTASYEARKFGVHSAMPIAKAYQLCPDGIYVHGRMKRYAELSYQIMNIFRDFSPDVQQISIDEAFIDLTGTEKLFGPPEETAYKIKKMVKEQTGLTVSVGLAPTKYLAKIASDMNKPDGFYCIQEGQEESFMLNLPLKKVWGIGDKTLEALNTAGIRTTRDVYDKSLQALIFMFGDNTGNFLYKVVRGIETVDFDRKTKSHSISNETTFPYDVTDPYTAETTILELCHCVMFRLLREKGFSKTVMVKIRYEDFSTVSIQQTYSDYVLTLDSLYSRAKELFEHKYERGRGIRLIGIGLENIDTTQKPTQQSLFDDGSEKKQNVEKAILKLEKKHPEIKIHKARMLQKLNEGVKALLFFAAAILFYLSAPLKSTAQETQPKQEESTWTITGWWKGELTGSLNTTFGYSNPFGFSAPLPVFKQEIDLSAFIQITPQLYFSLEFLDEFKHNTYTFGYKGDGYLKEFKFSNRGITFPAEYSSSLLGYGTGGGDNQAPGLMFHFEQPDTQKWKADILLRYDMVQTKSMTFYGKNRVDMNQTPLDDYMRSYMFYIPSDAINLINAVYVQSKNGKYSGSNGVNYEKLLESEYLIIPQKNLLVLSTQAQVFNTGTSEACPYIVISFSSQAGCEQLLQATGSYTDSSTFAGELMQYFKVDLTQFSSLEADKLTTVVNGSTGIIIQSPVNFSPYACANLYQSKTTGTAEYQIIDTATNQQAASWYASPLVLDGFFDSKAAGVYKTNKDESSLSDNDYSLASTRFPFADTYPNIYLYRGSTAPLAFATVTTTSVKEYDIGKFVQAGSVRVYKNGISVPAKYDKGTGFVTLESSVSELDKIYITYCEESNNLATGAFTAALGFMYNFTPSLVLDLSYTGIYPYFQKDDYATADAPKETFSALTAGLTYNSDFMVISDTLSAAYKNQNLTNLFVANTYSNTQDQTNYLSRNSGSKTQVIPKSPQMPNLEQQNNYTVNKFDGLEDKKISGYKIPLSYDFSKAGDNGSTQNLWASVDINLSKADSLYKADQVEFAFLPSKELAGQNLSVYLLLGASEPDQNQELPVWEITSLLDQNVITALDLNNPVWQTVKIRLTPLKRAKLGYSHNARLVIVKESYTPDTDSPTGTLYAGPYRLVSPLMQITDGKSIQSAADLYKKNEADLEWKLKDTWQTDSDRTITSLSYFEQADFSAYKTISFDFAITAPASLEYSLINSYDQKALEIKLPLEVLEPFCDGQKHTLSINTKDKAAFIDSTLLDPQVCCIILDKAVIPSAQKIVIVPQSDGHLYASNLCYKETQPGFEAKNLAQAKFNFESGGIEAKYEQGLSTSGQFSYYIDSSVSGFYTLAGIKAAADASTTMDGLKNAGHSLITQEPLFKILDFGETYRFTADNVLVRKNDYIKIDTKPLFTPFSVSISAQSSAQKELKSMSNQQYLGKLSFDFDINKNTASLYSSLTASQKLFENTALVKEYFNGWYKTSVLQFSGGEKQALRNTSFIAGAKAGIPKAGLSPVFEYELTGAKVSADSKDYSWYDKYSFTLPFTLPQASHAITFWFNHKNTRLQTYAGKNYTDDLAFIFSNAGGSSNLTFTSTNYEVSWRRKLFNNFNDLLVPLSAGAGFTTEKSISAGSTKLVYQIKANVTDSYISRELELTETANVTVRFSDKKSDSTYYLISDAAKLLFNLGEQSFVTVNTDFSLESTNALKIKLGTGWNRRVDESLLLVLTNAVWKQSRTMDLKATMNDSISFSLTNTKASHIQTYGYQHDSALEFLNNCSITSGAGLLFGFEKGKTFKLSLEYKLGAKINF